jgi:hypothetical protein
MIRPVAPFLNDKRRAHATFSFGTPPSSGPHLASSCMHPREEPHHIQIPLAPSRSCCGEQFLTTTACLSPPLVAVLFPLFPPPINSPSPSIPTGRSSYPNRFLAPQLSYSQARKSCIRFWELKQSFSPKICNNGGRSSCDRHTFQQYLVRQS